MIDYNDLDVREINGAVELLTDNQVDRHVLAYYLKTVYFSLVESNLLLLRKAEIPAVSEDLEDALYCIRRIIEVLELFGYSRPFLRRS